MKFYIDEIYYNKGIWLTKRHFMSSLMNKIILKSLEEVGEVSIEGRVQGSRGIGGRTRIDSIKITRSREEMSSSNKAP